MLVRANDRFLVSSTNSSVIVFPSTHRAKRQATTVIYNDENSNPFTTRETRSCARGGDSIELDELADAVPIRNRPAKLGLDGSRLTLSPAKIKAHFNTVKTKSSMFLEV